MENKMNNEESNVELSSEALEQVSGGTSMERYPEQILRRPTKPGETTSALPDHCPVCGEKLVKFKTKNAVCLKCGIEIQAGDADPENPTNQ